MLYTRLNPFILPLPIPWLVVELPTPWLVVEEVLVHVGLRYKVTPVGHPWKEPMGKGSWGGPGTRVLLVACSRAPPFVSWLNSPGQHPSLDTMTAHVFP